MGVVCVRGDACDCGVAGEEGGLGTGWYDGEEYADDLHEGRADTWISCSGGGRVYESSADARLVA